MELKTIIAAAAMLATMGGFASAADTPPHASVNSQSQSGSQATAEVEVISGSQAGASIYQEASNGIAYSGSYEVRSAPSIGAPGVISANQCALGISGGISVIGGGASFGGMKIDPGCELRAEAAAVMAVAGTSAAIRHLARDPEMCQTFRASGVIPEASLCTKAEKLAAAKAKVSTRNAPAARTATGGGGYTSCVKGTDGAIRIKIERGFDQATAVANCRAALKRI